MNEAHIAQQRRELLSKAIDHLTFGDRSAFGRRLGFKDGAFIRQMLNGSRAVSEKTIRHIESIPGMRGWFTQADGNEPPALPRAHATNASPDDIAARYHASSVPVQRLVELVLRQPSEPVPEWATPALLSVVTAGLVLAQELDTKQR